MKIEILLKGILDLGLNHPEYSDAAFSLEFLSGVIMMFPQKLMERLDDCPGQKEELMKNILAQVEKWREKAQSLQLRMETSSSHTAGVSGGPGAGGIQQHSQVS